MMSTAAGSCGSPRSADPDLVGGLVQHLHLLFVHCEPDGEVGDHEGRQAHLVPLLRHLPRPVQHGDAHAAALVPRDLRRGEKGRGREKGS